MLPLTSSAAENEPEKSMCCIWHTGGLPEKFQSLHKNLINLINQESFSHSHSLYLNSKKLKVNK